MFGYGNNSLYDAGSVSNMARSTGPRPAGVNESLQTILNQRKTMRPRGGTQMNLLPETSFGAANPGIASNNLAMAKARGGLSRAGAATQDSMFRVGRDDQQAGPATRDTAFRVGRDDQNSGPTVMLEGGGSRTLLPDGRVSAVGRPLEGYQHGDMPAAGYDNPMPQTPQQRASMGLAPVGSQRGPAGQIDPMKFQAARESRKARLQKARQMQFMNARFNAAKTGRAPMVDAEGNPDLLATLGINFANRPEAFGSQLNADGSVTPMRLTDYGGDAAAMLTMRDTNTRRSEASDRQYGLEEQKLAADQSNADRQFGLARRESRADIADRRMARKQNAALMPFEQDQRELALKAAQLDLGRGEWEFDQAKLAAGDMGEAPSMADELLNQVSAGIQNRSDAATQGINPNETLQDILLRSQGMDNADVIKAVQDAGYSPQDLEAFAEQRPFFETPYAIAMDRAAQSTEGGYEGSFGRGLKRNLMGIPSLLFGEGKAAVNQRTLAQQRARQMQDLMMNPMAQLEARARNGDPAAKRQIEQLQQMRAQ